MKKKTKLIIIVMALFSLLALDAQARTISNRIAIISDVHLISPELMTSGGAIDRADASDSKMMAMSDDIMASLVDSLIDMHPVVVMLTGDLTYNGERLSHERMAWHLSRLKQNGIQPLVIPGNHDCNNPNAKCYDGDDVHPTATVSREEFAQLYSDFGYGEHSMRDTASLSYCCEPIEGIVIIGIDSNMDELNTLTSRGDSSNSYHNGGRIKPETLQWVIDQATLARQQGKHIIAMMHHHLVQHFDQEDRLLANYIVQHHDTIAQQLMQAGVHTVFTGHLHVTDAATQCSNDGSDSIVEIATGSAICYPFALRTATINDEGGTLDIDTRWLTSTSSCPSLREQGRQRIINATPGMANMLSSKAWSKLGGRMNQLKAMIEMGGGKANLPETPQQATQLVLRHLSEVLSRTMLAVVEGNEQEQDVESIIEAGKQGIHSMIEEVAPDQVENLWEFFLNEVYPKLDPLVRSILEDRTGMGTSVESHADDLRLTVKL
ncbi:MAG: metallophosphoesterase [Muribaculaceae bacterium]|nr:metallophosphoesterase [Muribaculaceae bacterium]